VSADADTGQEAPPTPPATLDIARHRDLAGRNVEPWFRRAVMLGCAAIAIAALLGVFGQEASTSRASSAAATLEVRAPDTVRGGLIFQARFDIHATSKLEQPTLELERGWFDSISVNSIEPNPSSESSIDDRVQLEFEPLPAGQTRTVWIYFQANPTNYGRQRQRTALNDGDRELATVDRSITVYP
jgi:hypothetical protein